MKSIITEIEKLCQPLVDFLREHYSSPTKLIISAEGIQLVKDVFDIPLVKPKKRRYLLNDESYRFIVTKIDKLVVKEKDNRVKVSLHNISDFNGFWANLLLGPNEKHWCRSRTRLFSLCFEKLIKVSTDEKEEAIVYEYKGCCEIDGEEYDCIFYCNVEDSSSGIICPATFKLSMSEQRNNDV